MMYFEKSVHDFARIKEVISHFSPYTHFSVYILTGRGCELSALSCNASYEDTRLAYGHLYVVDTRYIRNCVELICLSPELVKAMRKADEYGV